MVVMICFGSSRTIFASWKFRVAIRTEDFSTLMYGLALYFLLSLLVLLVLVLVLLLESPLVSSRNKSAMPFSTSFSNSSAILGEKGSVLL